MRKDRGNIFGKDGADIVIVALRYVEKPEGSYWEVRTEETTEQHRSLRQFQEEKDITSRALRALEQPGEWVELGDREADGNV